MKHSLSFCLAIEARSSEAQKKLRLAELLFIEKLAIMSKWKCCFKEMRIENGYCRKTIK